MILWIGGGVAYFIYYYQPQQAVIAQKLQVIDKKKREVREIELTKRMLEETKEEIERLKSDIVRLEKFFPEEVFIPRVLVLVENLAMATHVEISFIRPSAAGAARRPTAAPSGAAAPAPATTPAAGEGEASAKLSFNEKSEYRTSEIDFKVSGTFQNIYNFMNELSTFPKLVVVDRLTLTPTSTGKEERRAEGQEEEGGAETGREVEVGGYIELSADLPLTFYIQTKEAPELVF